MGRYVPIRDYAVIGDGRTVALVARDGAIDWLCLPNMDSPSVFAAILDAERGGSFELCPTERYETTRRYRPGTNVLETTFTTTSGRVRVTDAMTLPDGNLGPLRELARRVEGLSGRVAMRWRATPRFDYGRRARLERRGEIPVASHGADGVAFGSWDAGAPEIRDGGVSGRFEMAAGRRALLGVFATCNEPLVFPPRAHVEARLDATAAFWERWSGQLTYAGPWRDAVVRSALALKLLVFAPSGAITAAPTTSLPEAIGGERNWDYRYCWIRDSSFTIEALLQLGCRQEATSFFWWFMHATRLTSPRLRVLYRLDGGAHVPERVLDHLSGYRGSRRRPDRPRHDEPARGARRLRGRPLARSGRGNLGSADGAPALHRVQGHVLGCARSSGPARRERSSVRPAPAALAHRGGGDPSLHRRPLLVGAARQLRPVRRS